MVRAEEGASPRGHPQNRTEVFGRRSGRRPWGRGLDSRREQAWRLVRSSTCSSATPSWRALEDLIGRGRRRRPCCWRSRGHPGIGKTALMARGEVEGRRGRDAGARCARLRARALILLRRRAPALRAVARRRCRRTSEPTRSPARRRSPSRSSTRRAVAAEPGPTRRLATLHGLYWLTANLAARRPLLLAIDDLHWCDLPSLRWLAYLLPRMEGLALSVVVGLRPAEEPARIRACWTRSWPTRWRP